MNNRRYCSICHKETDSFVDMKNCKYTINKSTIEFSSKARFCAECNNEIYDRELDQLTSEKAIQLYNQQHGIPGIDIVNFRKEHNLTQESLCKFLQISKKTLISYEKEQAIPNAHYMTLLKAVIGDPSILSSLSEAGGISVTDKEKEFLSSVSEYTHEQPATINEFHGYTSFSVEKLINIILKFTEKGLGLTKLNKGLFYSDFSNYNKTASSITGLSYIKYYYGPFVPDLYNYLALMQKRDLLKKELVEGPEYQYSKYTALKKANLSVLTKAENAIVAKVAEYLKSNNAEAISSQSHLENAWLKTDDGAPISYEHALELSRVF